MSATDLDAVIRGCTAAHQRLFQTVGQLDDEQARAPSRLPGWTVGHVLTHLARNADSHSPMLDGAMRVEAVEQYAGGHDQRAADINAGSGRPADQLIDDVRTSAVRLEATWKRMTPASWDRHGLARGRPWPCSELPFHRWREVEVHHADLGLGYDHRDWPEVYVDIELPRALATVPSRLRDPAARRQLVAWLLGRDREPGRLALAGWQEQPESYFAGPLGGP